MTLLVPYLRVSTDEQSVDSSGQLNAIATWAAQHGFTLAEPCVDEGISGALGPDKRPGLAQALAAVSGRRRGKPAGIIAYDRTRLCRDASLCGWLAWTAKEQGFRLVTTDGYDSSDSSDTALIMGAVQGAFGELQRRAIAAATKKALAARKARGEVAGKVPFGYRREGKRLEPEPAEMATLARLYVLADEHGPRYAEIAARMNREGLRRRQGDWTRTAVWELLRKRPTKAS